MAALQTWGHPGLTEGGREPSGLDVQRLPLRKPPSCAPSWRARRETGQARGPASHGALERTLWACRTRLLGPRPQHRPPGCVGGSARSPRPAQHRAAPSRGPFAFALVGGAEKAPSESHVRTEPNRTEPTAGSGQAVRGGRAGQHRGAIWFQGSACAGSTPRL